MLSLSTRAATFPESRRRTMELKTKARCGARCEASHDAAKSTPPRRIDVTGRRLLASSAVLAAGAYGSEPSSSRRKCFLAVV